jgi:hypothetical protein
MKTIVPVVTIIVFALALMPASAAAKHKRQTNAATASQQQIACTVVGCHPVPRGCHPEMGYTMGGTPTVLMWRHVRGTRFTETGASRNAVTVHVRYWR